MTIVTAHLKRVVLGKCHDFHHFAHSGEYLVDDIQGDGVDHVLHNHPEHGVGAARLTLTGTSQGLGCL